MSRHFPQSCRKIKLNFLWKNSELSLSIYFWLFPIFFLYLMSVIYMRTLILNLKLQICSLNSTFSREIKMAWLRLQSFLIWKRWNGQRYRVPDFCTVTTNKELQVSTRVSIFINILHMKSQEKSFEGICCVFCLITFCTEKYYETYLWHSHVFCPVRGFCLKCHDIDLVFLPFWYF